MLQIARFNEELWDAQLQNSFEIAIFAPVEFITC